MNYYVSDSECPEHNVSRLACMCPEELNTKEVLNLSEESEESEESSFGKQAERLYPSEESEESEESDPKAKAKKIVLGTRLSTIKPVATHWAISNFIPLNSFSVLAGREGLGKSTLAIEWASQGTQGKLQGDLFGTPINVAYVASEDSPEQTLAPRFIVAMADTERVFLPHVVENGEKRFLSFPKDLKAIRDFVLLNEIRLLIIDPVPSVIDEKLDTYKDSSVRQALTPLAELAQTANVTVLGLLHVGKSDSPDFNNRVLGSRAFTAVPRSVLALMRDNDESGEVLLVGVNKSNLGSMNVPMKVFRLESATLEVENGSATVGAFNGLENEKVELTNYKTTELVKKKLLSKMNRLLS
jgi:predicted ATP-dependent serine protease